MREVDLSIRRFILPPMHREGRTFVALVLLLAVVVGFWRVWLALPVVLLAYGVYLFFRDPERVVPADAAAITSPADGIVCMVTQCPLPSQLAAESVAVWRVCVFMSVLDVHVNRMPVSGEITKRVYIPGKFINASRDKASEDNERMLYLAKTAAGDTVAFVQIAGLIARRIVSFAEEQESLSRGERFGLIRFGSRVDLYLPSGVEPLVAVGQTVVAGETTMARLPG